MKQIVNGLYAITPEWTDTKKLLTAARSALEGHTRFIQYRNKSEDVALQYEQASELLLLCHEFDVPLIINDNLRLADLVNADGLHLGDKDGSFKEARFILGPDKIIGVSCYANLTLAISAESQGADYVAFGSFFASTTKPQAPPAPIHLLHQAKQQLHIPVVAIGGITPDNALTLIQAGADAVAVISSLFEYSHIVATANKFNDLFNRPQYIQ